MEGKIPVKTEAWDLLFLFFLAEEVFMKGKLS
jgi:hypothetical protein